MIFIRASLNERQTDVSYLHTDAAPAGDIFLQLKSRLIRPSPILLPPDVSMLDMLASRDFHSAQ